VVVFCLFFKPLLKQIVAIFFSFVRVKRRFRLVRYVECTETQAKHYFRSFLNIFDNGARGTIILPARRTASCRQRKVPLKASPAHIGENDTMAIKCFSNCFRNARIAFSRSDIDFSPTPLPIFYYRTFDYSSIDSRT